MPKFIFDLSSKTKPYPHQLEAVEFIRGKEYIPLFDEQGLGKTKIVIDSVLKDIEDGYIDGTLIICKKYLIPTWEEEILKHSHLKPIILKGTSKELGQKFLAFSYFYIINYDAIFSEKERLKMFLKLRNMAIVLDESQRIKNPEGIATKAINEIKNFSKKRIIITGTPIANKPVDIWSQFYFLDGGKLLGDNFEDFKKKYDIDLREEIPLSERTKILESLRDIINNVSIRRLKADVLELPEKKFEDAYVQLKGKQLEIYTKLKDELILEIESLEGNKIIDESSNILKKLLRLTQIASNPKLVIPEFEETPIKFLELDKLLEKLLNSNEKVIVWSSFNGNIRTLKNRYAKYGASMLFGEIPIDDRKKIVNNFQKQAENKIIIANPAAAKEGLTLTAANNAIYIDRNFNLVDYLQSQDRIHRISQTKTCKIIKIQAKDTIDEYIDEILYKKQKIAQFLQGDLEQIPDEKEFLTKSEILYILGKS
ncbi:Uncharacterised protein [uncultured archaeon]|nr:Uncharacterised protein [uncultured archaeon]